MSSCHNKTNNLKEGLKENSYNKIRKRNCSSSSSSSLARKYRFKRAILVGKKGGSTTPVPLWKTSSTTSPSMDTTTQQVFHSSASGLGSKDKEKEISVSARKLAATLWEINDMQQSSVKKEFEVEQMRSCKETTIRRREKAVSLSRSGLLRPLMSDPCNSPISERMKGFESDGYRRTGLSHHPLRSGVDAHTSEKNCSKNAVGVKSRLKEARSGLSTSKKLRKQTERLNKKIAIEMATIKASHMEVCKELEREKRAKEILEQICDELARGIGEDKAQVEEMKKESVKVLEEVEKEREMLQLADILREERVQMKLSEAKYQFEEKNDFLEKLRNELENFIKTRDEENGDISPGSSKFNDLETYFNNICQGFQNAEKVNDSDEDGSDLVSIELNMNNDNRGYEWSYGSEKDAQNDSKRVSTDKESTGRKSSERIQWGSICFNKRNSSFKKRDLPINIQEFCDHLDLSRARIQDNNEGTPRNRSISDANHVHRKDNQLTLQCNSKEAGENALLALEGENLKQEEKKSRCYLKSFDSDS
ncbi:unnamed protein product [Trifolium pratense]|uniref:Uncharacterized protein n=1 Tax=Trifolium pratense TaxID=57577 RepID=A0ACB0KF76_TRIPR|nr:unnamed protein product [Trifolium pratense]